MRRAILLSVGAALLSGIFGVTTAGAATPNSNAVRTFAPAVRTAHFGTIQGTVTTLGGQPLNGMCLHLFNTKYTTDEIQFAPSGTTGQPGFFTQANIPVGHYKGLFINCGANTNGTPDPNYTNIFYGGTFNPKKALHIRVVRDSITNIGTSLIPLGGTVTGTVTDSTANQPAWPLVVQAQIPKDTTYNAAQVILTVCAGTDGTFSISGVPTSGANIVFAPAGWSCPDGSGTFVTPFNQTLYSGLVAPNADGTVSGINGSVTENGSPF
jgi:hypothetical protein